MNRTTTRTSGDRVVASLSRGIIRTINDSPYMQELGVRIRDQQDLTEVEHWHSAGVTHYPMPPDAKGAAEIILATLTGNNSHPIALPAADRRFRPNGMRPGDTAVADANKQTIHLNEVSVVLDSPKRFDLRVTSGQGRRRLRTRAPTSTPRRSRLLPSPARQPARWQPPRPMPPRSRARRSA